MSPFSLRNRSIMCNSAPACLGMLWTYAYTLPDHAGLRQSCSFSVQSHHRSHPDAHGSSTVRLSETWAGGGCCTHGDLQIQGIPGDTGCSLRVRAGVWKKGHTLRQHRLCFPQGQERAEGLAIQPKSSPACLHMLACPYVLVGVELSNRFFFFFSCTMLIVITGGLIVNSTMKPVK